MSTARENVERAHRRALHISERLHQHGIPMKVVLESGGALGEDGEPVVSLHIHMSPALLLEMATVVADRLDTLRSIRESVASVDPNAN